MIKLADIILAEKKQQQNKSEKFVRKVRDDVYPVLLNQAKFVINLIKNGKNPSDPDVMEKFNYYMRHDPDLNPIDSVDTYGINLVLGYLLKNHPKLSGRAKRYHKRLIDARLENRV